GHDAGDQRIDVGAREEELFGCGDELALALEVVGEGAQARGRRPERVGEAAQRRRLEARGAQAFEQRLRERLLIRRDAWAEVAATDELLLDDEPARLGSARDQRRGD